MAAAPWHPQQLQPRSCSATSSFRAPQASSQPRRHTSRRCSDGGSSSSAAAAAAGAGESSSSSSAGGAPPLSRADAERLRGAVAAAAAAAVAFFARAGEARARITTMDDPSPRVMPRRHLRHLNERFTDHWAEAVAEAEQLADARVRSLAQQLEQETRRANEEEARRRDLERQLRVLRLQKEAPRPPPDDDLPLTIKILGADLTGPLLFAGLMGGAYYWWAGREGGAWGRRGRGGRWVYDRALGGKKVWVPAPDGAGALPGEEQLSDAAFDELAAKAASAAAAQRAKQRQPYSPPAWWEVPMSFAADDATRAAAQLQASALLARIEQAKNTGRDYRLRDIAALRRTCQAGGGVVVDARTVGGRDAVYKAAVDGAVRRCVEPSAVDEAEELADASPLGFCAGVAQDLQIPDERAVGMLCNWVAGHCRGRVVEAYTAAKKGDDVGAATALTQLSALLQGLPVLEPASAQVDLIADELRGWADNDTLSRVQQLARQLVEPEQRPLVAAMLGQQE